MSRVNDRRVHHPSGEEIGSAQGVGSTSHSNLATKGVQIVGAEQQLPVSEFDLETFGALAAVRDHGTG